MKVVVALWFCFSACFCFGSVDSTVSDYSDWDVASKPIRSIEGDWQFYWQRFITPEQFVLVDGGFSDFDGFSIDSLPALVPMPKFWKDVELLVDGELQNIGPNGWATYRKKIVVSPTLSRVALRVPDIISAYKLWVNGNLLATVGVVGASQSKSYHGPNGSNTIVVDLHGEKSSLDIVIQVSNFNHFYGGTWKQIEIGDVKAVQRSNVSNLFIDGVTISTLLIMGFYHVGLFFLRRKNPSVLFFGVYCLVVAVRASISGSGFVYGYFFGDLDGQLARQLEYITFFIGGPVIYHFLVLLYPQELSSKYDKLYGVVCLVCSLVVVLTPMAIFTRVLIIVQFMALPASVLGLMGLGLAIKRKRESAIIVSLGFVFLILGTFNDMFLSKGMPSIGFNVVHVGLFLLVLCQSIALAKIFTNAFEQVEVSENYIKNLNRSLLDKNKELNVNNEQLDRLVSDKTRDVKSILEAIQQGILAIEDGGGRVGIEHSKYLEELLGRSNIGGANFYDLLFEHGNLDGNEKSQIMGVVSASIGRSNFSFIANSHLLPRETVFRFNGQERICELDWNPVIRNQVIVKILLVVRDVTDLRSLDKVAKKKEREMDIVLEIVNIPPEKFYEMIAYSCRVVEQNHKVVLESNHFEHEAVRSLFRNMHSLKGLARTYNLKMLAEAAHSAEQVYSDCEENREWTVERMVADLKNISVILDDYKRVSDKKLRRASGNRNSIILDRSNIEKKFELLSAVDVSTLSVDDQITIESIKTDFRRVACVSLEQVLSDQVGSVASLAAELGKGKPVILFDDPGFSINEEAHELLNSVFIHLIRNSMDHGIESEADRIAAGKAPCGTISFELVAKDDKLTITYADDGRGLNLARLYEKAVAQGLVEATPGLGAGEIASLVFRGGLSTVEKVSSVSGRGVGLDAAKSFLEKAGCSIDLKLSHFNSAEFKPTPFKFVISMPPRLFKYMEK